MLITRDGILRIFARGADDNLYWTSKAGAGPWGFWNILLGDGSVKGRFEVALTSNAGDVDYHIVHIADGGCRYVRVFEGNQIDSRDWPGCLEAAIDSSGPGQVGIFRRTGGGLIFETVNRLSNGSWVFLSTKQRSTDIFALSNVEYLNGKYHVLTAEERLVDDASNETRHELTHRFHDSVTGEGSDRIVKSYTPNADRHVQPALSAYRNRLLAVWSNPNGQVNSARWDIADHKSPWVSYGWIGRGKSSRHPAAIDFDHRPSIVMLPPNNPAFANPNYGNDAFATIVGTRNGGRPEVINLSRRMMFDDIFLDLAIYNAQVDSGDDVCKNYDEPSGPVGVINLASDNRAVLTEIGFNMWMLPTKRVGGIYRDLTEWMCSLGGPPGWSDDLTPCLTKNLPVHLKRKGSIFHCQGAWNNHTDTEQRIWEELGHYFAAAIGLGSKIGKSKIHRIAAAERSGLSQGSIENGRHIFSIAIRQCPQASPRCTGFVGVNGNYDNTSLPHSFLYAVQYYIFRGDELRQMILDDLDVGNPLLQNKYNWIRQNLFEGREFRDGGVIIN